MSNSVNEVKKKIPNCCQAKKCDKDGCKLCLNDAPNERVLVDMDCKSLDIQPNRTRCDYLFVGQLGEAVWVAPIELKSGAIHSVTAVSGQLQAGAEMAHNWLPENTNIRLTPILGLGKSIHKHTRLKLLRKTIIFRGKKFKIQTLKCREQLTNAYKA